MKNNKAIPQGFMTVGELAKKMNTTVRTLQYYDKEGLLSPSAESEGGRRLYIDKDMVKLHQILSLKYLGFSLGDIKNRIISLDTPAEVANVLAEQAKILELKINEMSEALSAIKTLKAEILQMQTVDFSKYADIIKLFQLGNENYWVLKYFDDKTMKHIQTHFTEETGNAVFIKWQELCKQACELQKLKVTPESEKGQAVAKEWWDMILEFTGGDMSLLPELEKFEQSSDKWNDEIRNNWLEAESFLSEGLQVYFQKQGQNPFTEGVKE